MVLKIEEKNEKILKAKKRINKLHTKYCDLIDKLGYFRSELKDCKNLTHRSECPLCRQKIDWKYFENKIPELERKIKIIEAWINQNYNYNRRCRIGRPIAELEYKQNKERKEQIELYLENNRNKLNKAIRTLELPMDITTNDEKEIWNDAIELQLDKRGMDEIDELEFEILT